MRRTRTGALGSLLLLAAATGCGAATPRTAAPTSDAAAGPAASAAPRWCAELAGSGSIAALPGTLGLLTADPWNFDAHQAVTAARADLGNLLATLRAGSAPAAATTALQDLVAAVGTVADTGPRAGVAERISADLTAVGTAVQPVCDFPA